MKHQRKNLIWQVPFLVLLIVGTVIIIRQQHAAPYQHNRGIVFGTSYNVTYQADKDLQADIEAVLHQVDDEFSMFNQLSTTALINRGEKAELSDMFREVFEKSRQVSDDTDGAFDITVAPLVNAWGFGFKNEQLPSRQQVDSLMLLIGYQTIAIDGDHVTKQNPQTMLDFSAIAKGYGCDVVARVLQQHNVANYMVEVGGEVVTRGINPDRVPWRIGVTKPTDDSLMVSQELQTVLNVTDMAMATSGNYRNFYYSGGRKYAHTIDPKTGYPVQHSLLSATVLAPDCATADAYATSFMVMGIDKAKAVLDRHPDMMAYFIYTDPQGQLAVWYSPTLKDKIVE